MKYLSLAFTVASASRAPFQKPTKTPLGVALAKVERASYPGEPYRAPYLEHVARDLDEELVDQLGETNVPEEMDHILCMFETYAGTEEWEHLGCDKWLEGYHEDHTVQDQPQEVEEPEHEHHFGLGQTYRMTVASEPSRFMRHRGYEYWLDPNTDNSQLYLDDSSHTIRAALDGTADAISFESVNFPGFYLRHAGYTCQLNQVDGSHLFNMDASFVPILVDPSEDLSAANCERVAAEAGLEIGGEGYPFEGDWGTKGCYTYTSGTYLGHAYYGTGGSDEQMLMEHADPIHRIEGYDMNIGGIKLQSTNYPQYLLSHDNQRVRISHFADINADGLTHAEWIPTERVM